VAERTGMQEPLPGSALLDVADGGNPEFVVTRDPPAAR